jgi:serine/threonine-protein phosphatase 5
MNKMYGFEGEVLHKYDQTVMKLFNQVFNWLPLAAVIQDKIFVVHGGITTEDNGVTSLASIEAISRNRYVQLSYRLAGERIDPLFAMCVVSRQKRD